MAEDTLSKKMMEAQTAQLKDEMSSVYDSLVTDVQHHQLPENVFKDYFLPFFSGSKPISTDPQMMTNWISIAGTPTNEVDVVDGGGNVLFTVPSLFDTSVIETVKREVGNSLSDIVHNFELKNNNIPVVADRYLNNQLTKKLGIVKSEVDHSLTEQRWNDILSRYGIKPTDPVKGSQRPQDDLTDDIIY